MIGLARLAAVILVVVMAACAPRLVPPGPPIAAPALNHDHILTADGIQLPMRRWLPDREPTAVVLALHGFNDYSNAFAGPGSYLAERGIAVYAYDQRGFGEAPNRGLWPGTLGLASDVGAAVRLLAGRHPGKPLYLLGESMGGAVAMVASTGPASPPVDGIILSAPAVWGRSTMNVFERSALWLFSRTVPWMVVSGRGLKITPSDNMEMLRALSRDPLVIKETRIDTIHGLVDLMDAAAAAAARLSVPALVLYGERDEIVPPRATYAMLGRLPEPGAAQRVAIYPRGYHMLMRDLQAEVVLTDVVSWIENGTAPLPSGADRRAATVLADILGGAAPKPTWEHGGGLPRVAGPAVSE